MTPVSGDPRPAQTRLNRDYGEVDDVSLVLIKGAKYRVALAHVSTDPDYDDEPRPDYDYTLTVLGGPSILTDDPGGMLGEHGEGTSFFAAGKSATLALLKIETQTVATSPTDRARKMIGVGEEVNLTLLPAGLGLITWNILSGSGHLSHYYSNGSILFTAPSEGDDTTVTATVSGGECEVGFGVIEPREVFFENKGFANTIYNPGGIINASRFECKRLNFDRLDGFIHTSATLKSKCSVASRFPP